MGTGVTIRVAHKLGQQDEDGTRKAITSSFYVCLIVGIIVGISCFLFSSTLLRMLNTKEELFDQAVLYLKIYAIGLPAMGIYNFGNGVLSAKGETKRPLMYLTFVGILNVILNLFFVIVCGRAAEGVAMASAIAQYVSAILVMYHVLHREDSCKLSLAFTNLDIDISKSIASMIIVILGSCVFRVVWVYTIFAYFHSIPSLYLLYAFSWAITGIAEIICFAYNYKKVTKIMKVVGVE